MPKSDSSSNLTINCSPFPLKLPFTQDTVRWVFMISNSVRSDRYINQLPPSPFVCINYLLVYKNSNKNQSPEVTFACKIWFVIIPKNFTLYLINLTDFLIMKNQNVTSITDYDPLSFFAGTLDECLSKFTWGGHLFSRTISFPFRHLLPISSLCTGHLSLTSNDDDFVFSLIHKIHVISMTWSLWLNEMFEQDITLMVIFDQLLHPSLVKLIA